MGGILGSKKESGERKSDIYGETETEGEVGVVKGGRGWHGAAVSAGTAEGQSSTPALSIVPVDQRQTVISYTHSNTW